MKKAFLPLIFFVSASVFFAKCKKDDSPAPTTVTANFSPLTVGSTWTYSYTEGTAAPKSFKLTATNRDTTVNGRTYNVLSSSDGANAYLTKSGNNYYRFASFPAIGNQSFEELYLKDNKALNESWDTATTIMYGGFTLPVALKYTIKGKGESRTVNGNSFSAVTHVRLDLSLSGSGVGGGDFYYQDGVGLIEDNIVVNPPLQPQYTSTEKITAYQIK